MQKEYFAIRERNQIRWQLDSIAHNWNRIRFNVEPNMWTMKSNTRVLESIPDFLHNIKCNGIGHMKFRIDYTLYMTFA